MQWYQIKVGQAGYIVAIQDSVIVWASATIKWMTGKTKSDVTSWILEKGGAVREIHEPNSLT